MDLIEPAELVGLAMRAGHVLPRQDRDEALAVGTLNHLVADPEAG
jgi:hypothetical protein